MIKTIFEFIALAFIIFGFYGIWMAWKEHKMDKEAGKIGNEKMREVIERYRNIRDY